MLKYELADRTGELVLTLELKDDAPKSELARFERRYSNHILKPEQPPLLLPTPSPQLAPEQETTKPSLPDFWETYWEVMRGPLPKVQLLTKPLAERAHEDVEDEVRAVHHKFKAELRPLMHLQSEVYWSGVTDLLDAHPLIRQELMAVFVATETACQRIPEPEIYGYGGTLWHSRQLRLRIDKARDRKPKELSKDAWAPIAEAGEKLLQASYKPDDLGLFQNLGYRGEKNLGYSFGKLQTEDRPNDWKLFDEVARYRWRKKLQAEYDGEWKAFMPNWNEARKRLGRP